MIVGTRESKLAMKQTEIFIEKLQSMCEGLECEVIGIKSLGDKDLQMPLSGMSVIGAFVRELDDALLNREIDVSVNSLKDIPITLTKGLKIGAVLERDSPEDIILPCPLDELPEGAVVGTSSVRRQHILEYIRPDLEIKSIRGNIHTRLSKLDRNEYDGIILAKAGLERMGIERPYDTLDPEVFIPAAAQGTIAIECRDDDQDTIDKLIKINDHSARLETGAERGIMKLMGAGCSSPVGINAKHIGDEVHVRAVSFTYTPEPIWVDTWIPEYYILDEMLDIADYLTGKTLRLKQ
ncbi:MAG TPA: hydroxymethylbilane synthase [Candidatus Methanomethylophilaceae archaeon]|nr:hydroxymethylbilane synthase [Candidatus Methanomethylophilaceae archaeon]